MGWCFHVYVWVFELVSVCVCVCVGHPGLSTSSPTFTPCSSRLVSIHIASPIVSMYATLTLTSSIHPLVQSYAPRQSQGTPEFAKRHPDLAKLLLEHEQSDII